MNLRPFGRTGLQVSEIGLGAWQLGADWGPVPEDAAGLILSTAVESGVNFIDTADVYGQGRSEELIGRFLKASGAKVFVATKLGRMAPPAGTPPHSMEAYRLHVEGSLKRLGLSALDLVQLHCVPTEVLRRGEVFFFLRRLQEQGKIRYFGASVESVDEGLLCLEQEGLSSLQVIFNIFRRKPAETLFDKAVKKGVALIVRLPLASGLLSGRFSKDSAFPEADHRHYNRDGQVFNVGETFAGLPLAQGVDLTEALRPLVPHGLTLSQFALRYCLDFPQVATVIPGASKPGQVRANAVASQVTPLSTMLHERLRDFYQKEVKQHIRGPY